MIEMINPAMVMKCVVYENGQRFEDIVLEQISHWLQREHAFVWLGLREANKALLSKIQDEFGETHLFIGPRFLAPVLYCTGGSEEPIGCNG